MNTELFFLTAFGLKPFINEDAKSRPIVYIAAGSDKNDVKNHLKHLRLKEMNRWHPDKLNRRTGDSESQPDESIGKLEGIKAKLSGWGLRLWWIRVRKFSEGWAGLGRLYGT